jgi:hypothetical protein
MSWMSWWQNVTSEAAGDLLAVAVVGGVTVAARKAAQRRATARTWLVYTAGPALLALLLLTMVSTTMIAWPTGEWPA